MEMAVIEEIIKIARVVSVAMARDVMEISVVVREIEMAKTVRMETVVIEEIRTARVASVVIARAVRMEMAVIEEIIRTAKVVSVMVAVRAVIEEIIRTAKAVSVREMFPEITVGKDGKVASREEIVFPSP